MMVGNILLCQYCSVFNSLLPYIHIYIVLIIYLFFIGGKKWYSLHSILIMNILIHQNTENKDFISCVLCCTIYKRWASVCGVVTAHFLFWGQCLESHCLHHRFKARENGLQGWGLCTLWSHTTYTYDLLKCSIHVCGKRGPQYYTRASIHYLKKSRRC